MTITLDQLAAVQSQADILQAVHEALADNTKVLADNVLRALLHYAKANGNCCARDNFMSSDLAQFHYRMPKLRDHLGNHASQLNVLQKELSDLRKYLGFESVEALKETVEAGITKPLPAPVKPAKRVTTSNRDKIIADAIARKKALDDKNKK